MESLPPLFCVRFFSRMRTPTTAEVLAQDERMAQREAVLWAGKSPVTFLSVDDKGTISSRGETEKERLMRAFSSTERYLHVPALKGRCFYMNGKNRDLAEEDARTLKQSIEGEQRFLIFPDINNDGIDSQTLSINPEQVDTVTWRKNTALFFSKPDNSPAKNRLTVHVDNISKEALMQALRQVNLSTDITVEPASPGFSETVYFKNIPS